jgi:hypothetical protein
MRKGSEVIVEDSRPRSSCDEDQQYFISFVGGRASLQYKYTPKRLKIFLS